MRRTVMFAFVGMLAGCSSEAETAKRQYDIVTKSGTLGEACSAARAVKQAYLKAEDTRQYQTWSVTAAINCQAADLTGANMPADPAIRAEAATEADTMTDAAIATASNATK